MKRLGGIAVIVLVLLAGWSPMGTAAPELTLIEDMRTGGLVLYWRHAKTDWSQSDEDLSDMSDCSRQRNLSEEGRHQAEVVGQALKALDIPVGDVLSSAFCRNIETAEIAFGRHEVDELLFNAPTARRAGLSADRLVTHLKTLLAEPPADPGRNTVIVGHNFNLQFAAGLEIDEGEIAVFRPERDAFTHLATLTPNQLRVAARVLRPD